MNYIATENQYIKCKHAHLNCVPAQPGHCLLTLSIIFLLKMYVLVYGIEGFYLHSGPLDRQGVVVQLEFFVQ